MKKYIRFILRLPVYILAAPFIILAYLGNILNDVFAWIWSDD